jgi:hypothetical protein
MTSPFHIFFNTISHVILSQVQTGSLNKRQIHKLVNNPSCSDSYYALNVEMLDNAKEDATTPNGACFR